jgi:non-ribosomal peptide synthetase component F/acyl carrier protein
MDNADHVLGDRSVHRLLAAQAEKTPAQTAVRCGDRQWTFAELNARANQVADDLRERGVRPGGLIALRFGRSLAAVAAALGVLKTGAGYVALDPDLSPEQINSILADARPALILDAASRFPAEGAAHAQVDCPSDDVAYVTYTWDPAGRPEGIIGTDRAITNRMNALPPAYEPDDVCALYFPLSAAPAASQVFVPLLHGVTVQIVADDEARDIRRLAEVLDRGRATSVMLPSAVLRQLVKAEPEVTLRLSRLRTIYSVGRAMAPELLEAFAVMIPNTAVHEMFGPAEAGGAVLLSAASAAVTEPSAAPLRAFRLHDPNTRVHILDDRSNLVPVGVDGEIHIGADDLSPGYWGRSDLTAQRFVSDPVSGRPGDRLFRTGEIGRWLPDGRIELLGRTTDQVTVQGHRFAVGLVEAVLEGHEHVRDAAVWVQPIGAEPGLVAYVVPDGISPTVGQLRDYLHARLPDYMVPMAFLSLDRLPQTSTGAIDRQALPLPEPSRPPSAVRFVAPRNDVEAGLVQIWAEVLMLDRVGIHDDFLELGGDSLIATQAVARVWERFGREVPFEAFFERATIAELAAGFFSDLMDDAAAPDGAVSAS